MLDTLISKIILPAQWLHSTDETNLEYITHRRTGRNRDKSSNVEAKDVRTEDGYWIRVYKITPDNFNPETIPEKKIGAHLYFNINGGTAEGAIATLSNLAEKTGIPVYTCNYRGVYSSKLLNEKLGHSSTSCNLSTLRQDGLALFNYALSDGAHYGLSSGQIELRGRSLGGVVAGETAQALRPYVDLESCPYLTTQQTLHTFTSVVMAFVLSSNSNYRYGHLHPTFFYFDNPLLKLIEFFTLKPISIALAIAAYCIVKPILLLTGWETNNGYNFASHPREKRRNLYIRTPEAIRQEPNVDRNHVDDKVIRPLAALNNAWRVDFAQRFRAWCDPAEAKRFRANKFYNQKDNTHAIKDGHNDYHRLTNSHDTNIDASIEAHINTLNGETKSEAAEYYYQDAEDTLKKTERNSLPTKREMNVNHFLQRTDLKDREKAQDLLSQMNKGCKKEQDVAAPASLAASALTDIQIILTYATTHAFVLTLYHQLLTEVSTPDSLLNNILHSRRSGLFSEASRFKATLLTEKGTQAPFATTRTFALIQKAFYTRLTEIKEGETNVYSEEIATAKTALLSNHQHNSSYLGSITNSLSWCLFGERKQASAQLQESDTTLKVGV